MFFSKLNEVERVIGEHAQSVSACYNAYVTAVATMMSQKDTEQYESQMHLLKKLESEADDARHRVIRQLLEGGLLVDSRKSLMHVIEGLDDVADVTEETVREFYLTNLEVVEVGQKAILEMNEITGRQLELLIKIIVQVVTKYSLEELIILIKEIEKLESDVDALQQKAIREIYALDLPLWEKMQQRQLIDKVASIADIIEDVSDLIEIIMMARKV